jgi:hypothetical protein
MKRKLHTIYWMLITLLALTSAAPDLTSIHAQQSNRAGLVVRFGDGSLTTRCVEFSGATISGYDLLTRSGLDIVAAFDSGQGTAICSIEGTGCPAQSCLTCDMPNYWSYWHLKDGAWVYSQAGASGYTVRDGDVEGWSWGSGGSPPVVPFDQICATFATDTPPPPTDTPVSEATPTHTPVPPTETPVPPTATPAPSGPTVTFPPPTPVVWFRLDENPISAGACTTVRWDTTHVQEVYLDGQSVVANGSLEVCPTASQEYRLRVVSEAGEQDHTLVLGVTGAAPPTSTPVPAVLEPTPSIGASPPTSTPILQPTVAASPTTSSSSPPPTPAPSPTPQPVAAAIPTQPHAPSPASTSTPLPTATTLPPVDNQSITIAKPATSNSIIGYTIFGVIVIGLVKLLIRGTRRRR